MVSLRAALVALVCTAAFGCQYRDPSIDLLEGELRWMEDQLYMMEDELQHKCAELATYRGQACACDCIYPSPATGEPQGRPGVSLEPQPTRPTPAEQPPRSPAAPQNGRSDSPQPDNGDYEIVEPSVQLPDPVTEPDPQLLEPPDLDMLEPEPAQRGPDLDDSEGTSLRPDDTGIRLRSYHELVKTAVADGPAEFDPEVTHIIIRAEYSHGFDFDDESTNADLLVVIEPRNADGAFVKLPGRLSVVVLDGRQTGEAARIARWDFDPDFARRMLRKSEMGRGIHLLLSWPGQPPESNQLFLFARYETMDGRQLEADVRLDSDDQPPRNGKWRVVDSGERSQRTGNGGFTAPTAVPKLLPVTSKIKLSPIPESRVAEERSANRAADEHAEIEMPVIKKARRRPEWKPYR